MKTIKYTKGKSVSFDIVEDDKAESTLKRYQKDGYEAKILMTQYEYIDHILCEIQKKHPAAWCLREQYNVRYFKTAEVLTEFVDVPYLGIQNAMNFDIMPDKVVKFFGLENN